MKNIYKKLKDGVHGTKETRKLWAAAIEGAIQNNRNTKDGPLEEGKATSTKFLNILMAKLYIIVS